MQQYHPSGDTSPQGHGVLFLSRRRGIMGIIILFIFAFGIFSLLRELYRGVAKRFLTAKAPAKTSYSVQEKDWEGYDNPTFIRRDIAFPVLTEKKRNRKPRIAQVQLPVF